MTSNIRVVVLGDRGVGKTTLARQLLTSEHLANYSTCVNFTLGKSSFECLLILTSAAKGASHLHVGRIKYNEHIHVRQ